MARKTTEISFILVVAYLLAFVESDPVRPCKRSRFPYFIADSVQCDKFYKCEAEQLTEELCPDGLVYEPESQSCFMFQRVNCGKRLRLQLARGNALCPRLNGRYPIENNCFAYRECDKGIPTLVNCPPSLIFDTYQAVCEFPDIANRTGCLAEEILNFTCPNRPLEQSEQVVLLFGDHERLPKVGDCRHFYMCLKSGHPRLGGCPFGLVFNPTTFYCDKPGNVQGCEQFYKAST